MVNHSRGGQSGCVLGDILGGLVLKYGAVLLSLIFLITFGILNIFSYDVSTLFDLLLMNPFQEKFKRYQSNLFRINKIGTDFRKLVDDFHEEEDLSFVLQELDIYDKQKAYIECENFVTFIGDKEFKKKISPVGKKAILDKIKGIIEDPQFRMQAESSIYHYLLDGLLEYTQDSSYISDLYDIIINDNRKDTGLEQIFEDYFRRNDMKDDFEKAFLRGMQYTDDDHFAYFLYEELWSYILKYDDLLESFIDVSSKDDGLTVKFFSSISQKLYTEEKDTDNMLKDMFLTRINSLNPKSGIIEKLDKLLRNLIDLAIYRESPSNYHDVDNITKTPLVLELSKYLMGKGYSYFSQIIDQITAKEKPIRPPNGIIFFLAQIIRKDDVKGLCQIQADLIPSLRLWIYDSIDLSTGSDILAEFRKFITEDLKLRDENTQKYHEEQRKQKEKREDKFKADIEVSKNSVKGKDYISDWLIYNYVNQKDLFNPEDVAFVKEQVIKFFEDTKNYLPEGGKLVVDKENKNSYTAPAYIVRGTFYNCMLLAKEFNLPLEDYKYKIITYLPFAYDDGRKFIIDDDNIKTLSEKEVGYLLSVYDKKRDQVDDLRSHNPINFVLAYKKYKSNFKEYDTGNKAITILTDFISDGKNSWINDMILDILGEELHDAVFFQDFFDKNIISGINYFNDILSNEFGRFDQEQHLKYKLALKANEILIKNFNNDSAIKWKLSQLLEADVQIPERPTGVVTGLSSLESEIIFHSDFIKSLKDINDIKYKDLFLQLLKHSFDLKKKNEKDASFIGYLWEATNAYFKKITDATIQEEIKKLCAEYEDQSYFFRSNYLNHG